MRSTWPVIVLVLTGTCSLAHPSWSQEVTLLDLAGKKIEMGSSETRIARIQSIERNQTATFSTQITVAADGSYKLVSTVRVNDERTGVSNRSFTVSGKFGQPVDFRDGKQVVLIEDGVLVWLRTLREGGYKARVAFKHTTNGLTCEVTGGYAQEVGVGKTTSGSTKSGNAVEIYNVKKQAPYCRVLPNG